MARTITQMGPVWNERKQGQEETSPPACPATELSKNQRDRDPPLRSLQYYQRSFLNKAMQDIIIQAFTVSPPTGNPRRVSSFMGHASDIGIHS